MKITPGMKYVATGVGAQLLAMYLKFGHVIDPQNANYGISFSFPISLYTIVRGIGANKGIATGITLGMIGSVIDDPEKLIPYALGTLLILGLDNRQKVLDYFRSPGQRVEL